MGGDNSKRHHRMLHGKEKQSTLEKILLPFGALVTVIKEEPERSKGDWKFASKSFPAAAVGYEAPDIYQVAVAKDNGRIKTTKSQNVKAFPKAKYPWPGVNLENRKTLAFKEFIPNVQTPQPNAIQEGSMDRITWVSCTRCGKWREVKNADIDALTDIEKVLCKDVGSKCSRTEDPRAWTETAATSTKYDEEESYYVEHFCSFVTEVVRKNVAESNDLFNDGMTHREAFKKATR